MLKEEKTYILLLSHFPLFSICNIFLLVTLEFTFMSHGFESLSFES